MSIGWLSRAGFGREASKLIFVFSLASSAPTLSVAMAQAEPAVAADALPQAERDDQARRHFRLGDAHYTNGEFDQAAAEFEQAYALSGRPQLLYNLYVSYRDAGNIERAANALRRYLTDVPNAENASQLRARLTAMERAVAAQGSTGTTTTTTTTATAAEPTTTTTTETATSQQAATTEGSAASQSSAPATTNGGGGISPVGIVIAGVGVVAMGVGVVTGLMTNDIQAGLDRDCGPMRNACPANFASRQSEGQSMALVTDVLLFGGLAVTGAGVAMMFLLADQGSSSQARTAGRPTAQFNGFCGPTGCQVGLSGTF